ncbi:MAG: chorismate synthase [Muribaculaceae bacterium]|nr:chorismate synthase [Muribaculaceae bacterium]
MALKNRIGNVFSLTSFGESHGPAIGGIVDGMPAGVKIDFEQVRLEMARRAPGQGGATSARQETDEVEFLSGIMDGVTLGTPIGFIIRNRDQRPADYDHLKNVYRPSHADFTYQAKYGIRDHRGGGRASARETAARVVAGALAKQVLAKLGITVTASQVSQVSQEIPQGDTAGGIVECVIRGVEAGVGEPVFGKLSSQLAEAVMSIPAAKGFEIGLGFDFVNHHGSEVLDKFVVKDGKIATATNFSGGIQGGISNGSDICFKVSFKPVATLMQPVEGIDSEGNAVTIEPRGRHDSCVVPRAIPVVEAMAAIVVLDNVLINRVARL